MKIENQKVVTLTYDMYIDGENGSEEILERATVQHPLTYCHGEHMMLPAFEAALAGKQSGDPFDFRLTCQEAYGEYDEAGLIDLDKQLFFNGDGEFDSERVYVGNIIPMNTVDGQIVNAQVIEIADKTVTIDLNHPLAGENLHFVGKIIEVRDASEKELEAIRHPHHCGRHCKGDCNDCGSHCGNECGGEEHHCGQDCKHNN